MKMRSWYLSCPCGHHAAAIHATSAGVVLNEAVVVMGVTLSSVVAIGSFVALQELQSERPDLAHVLTAAWDFVGAQAVTEIVVHPEPTSIDLDDIATLEAHADWVARETGS